MNDYTPTTGHILEAFAWDERYDGLDTEKMKQFDRWFAEVKAQACSHTFAQQLEEHSLAELIRMAKADAWEEGHNAQWEPCCDAEDCFESVPNPYRQGEEQ